MPSTMPDTLQVFSPAILPCGRIVRNRLVKVAICHALKAIFLLITRPGRHVRTPCLSLRWSPKWLSPLTLCRMGKARLGNGYHGQRPGLEVPPYPWTRCHNSGRGDRRGLETV